MTETRLPDVSMGDRIRASRQATGLSLIDVMFELRQRLPRSEWVTNETLRRYENGSVPEDKADPVLLAAVASILGADLREWSPLVADSAASVRELLDLLRSDSSCSSVVAGVGALTAA